MASSSSLSSEKHQAGGSNGLDPKWYAPQAEMATAPEPVHTWKAVLYEFSQNTTIHALKQITEPTRFTLRRVIWMLLLLGGLTLFVVQVVDSIIYYRSWPVAVNVRINYNESLIFPAITICNQNAFRATVASQMGLYELISHVYEMEESEAESLSWEQLQLATNMTLLELYLHTAHNMEDLIVSCSWDNSPCGVDDFDVTLTDHGVCYTFNSGLHGRSIVEAKQTGTARGLQLRLNIEQYEYMRGPNTGAGLKILAHNHGDTPLVRDLGLAIAPGSHALVGITTLQVNNLAPPYGKCDPGGGDLHYYSRYSMSTCQLDCLERHLVDACHCRHYYMAELSPGEPRVCTLMEYITCVRPTIDLFYAAAEHSECRCPIPCKRTLYDPIISYGSTANFDMDKMLRGNISSLSASYEAARETTQRVNRDIVASDHAMFESLDETMRGLEAMFADIQQVISDTLDHVDVVMNDLNDRIAFHIDRGLGGSEFITKHDFVRGWEVMEERTLPYVTTAFMETVTSIERLLNESGQLVGIYAEPDAQHTMWQIIDIQLNNKLELCARARANLTEVDEAYKSGKPLLTYKYSKDRRYDMAYISVQLLQENDGQQEEYFNYVFEELDELTESIEKLRELAPQLVYGQRSEVNVTAIKAALAQFTGACKGYNYRVFLIKDRIVEAPLDVVRTKLDRFKQLNQTLSHNYAHLKVLSGNINVVITGFSLTSWSRVKRVAEECMRYLVDPSLKKIHLAEMMGSVEITTALADIRKFFNEFRRKANDLDDAWLDLSAAYSAIYRSMHAEYTTLGIYSMLHDDVTDLVHNEDEAEFYVRHFAYLLREKRSELRDLVPHEFYRLLNADLPSVDLLAKLLEASTFFLHAQQNTSITGHLQNLDDTLFNNTATIQAALSEFLKGNVIDFGFFRENVLQLDVFVRELSYEEIDQQIAYDMTNLWSDIGGSIGLFIGASALSVFEVLDVFIHNSLNIHVKPDRQKKKQAPPAKV